MSSVKTTFARQEFKIERIFECTCEGGVHSGAKVEQKATCDIENEYENATYRFTQ